MARKKKPAAQAEPLDGVEVLEAYDLYEDMQPIPDDGELAIQKLKTREEVREYLELFLYNQTQIIPNRLIRFRDKATGKIFLACAYLPPHIRWEEMDE